MTVRYSVSEIDAFIGQVHAKAGDGAFQSMRLMELETLIRKHDTVGMLPGKTLLRERINAYRSTRWPATTPKKASDRFRW